jgi:hypothetical protein
MASAMPQVAEWRGGCGKVVYPWHLSLGNKSVARMIDIPRNDQSHPLHSIGRNSPTQREGRLLSAFILSSSPRESMDKIGKWIMGEINQDSFPAYE